MTVNIAINGFGRIGRSFLRSVLCNQKARELLKIVAINTGPRTASHLDILFQYDSIMGTLPNSVQVTDSKLVIDGHEIELYSSADPAQLNWQKYNIDWVIESSGCFTDGIKARVHCSAGAKKVLITAPATNEDITVIPGVNQDIFDKSRHTIVSLGSCTTNAFAPIVKVLQEHYGITQGLMTTMHAYTNDQVLLDVEHKDPRRARAAGINIVPTKTGADKIITKIFPALDGKIRATSIRVPVPVVSLLDFTFTTSSNLDQISLNQTFKNQSQTTMKNIIQYTDKPLVSSDYIGNESSCIFDSLLTQCTGNMGKVFAWYDNEYGYSCKLRDFLLHNA